ncbi:hypothetical protein COU37_05410 [Candidatus Micrarchaeota archaeon CG10_big_fil_rev_8_21_14_0_10_45_29]|nr:MAG: hypothetical protein COU37_05410 [Candidatus Micrarchaeota archaeon CG10_big_fil_rev_8_21_14_0_10_45_29]
MLNQRQLNAVETLKPYKENLRPVFERLKAQSENTELLYEKLEKARKKQPNVTVQKLEKQIEKYKKSLPNTNSSVCWGFFNELPQRPIYFHTLTDSCYQELLRIGCILPKEKNFYVGSNKYEYSYRPFHDSYMVFGLGLSPWLESLVPIDNLYFVMYGAIENFGWESTYKHNVLVDDVSKAHNLQAFYDLSKEQAKNLVMFMSNLKISSLALSYSSHTSRRHIETNITPVSSYHNGSTILFKHFRDTLAALYDSNKEFRKLVLGTIPKRLKEHKNVCNNQEKIRILADYPLDEIALSFALLHPTPELGSNPNYSKSKSHTGARMRTLGVLLPPTKLGPLSECAYDDLFLKVLKKGLLPHDFSFLLFHSSDFDEAISSKLFHYLPGAPSSSNVSSMPPYVITNPFDRVLITDTAEDIMAKAELYHRNSGMKKRLVFENFLLGTYDLVRREYVRKPYLVVHGNKAKLLYPNSDDRKTVFLHDPSWDVDRSNFYQQFYDKVLKPIQEVLRALFEGE